MEILREYIHVTRVKIEKKMGIKNKNFWFGNLNTNAFRISFSQKYIYQAKINFTKKERYPDFAKLIQ